MEGHIDRRAPGRHQICETCDGMMGRDSLLDDLPPLRKHERLCEACGCRVRRCQSCHEWLAFGWFNAPGSTRCTVCLDRRRRDKGWTADDTARLVAAARACLNLWPRHCDVWTDEDLVVWRAFLAATERTRPGEEAA